MQKDQPVIATGWLLQTGLTIVLLWLYSLIQKPTEHGFDYHQNTGGDNHTVYIAIS